MNLLSEIISPTFGWADDLGQGQNIKYKLLTTKHFMQQVDIFILPSIYDGWGAVVNEALQAGCYVICSDAAGASDLILNDKRLESVFHRGNVKQLAEAMSWCNEHIQEIRGNRNFRMQWTDEHISGKAVAKYMIDCLEKSMN